MKLPSKLYEILRWFTWIVLPATATLISAISTTWNLGWPVDQILTTFGAVETFIGCVLGVAKLTNDRE